MLDIVNKLIVIHYNKVSVSYVPIGSSCALALVRFCSDSRKFRLIVVLLKANILLFLASYVSVPSRCLDGGQFGGVLQDNSFLCD